MKVEQGEQFRLRVDINGPIGGLDTRQEMDDNSAEVPQDGATLRGNIKPGSSRW